MVCSSLRVLMLVDWRLDNRSVKRPDASFHLHRHSLSQPPPGWLKFMPNGVPYPDITIEIVVSDEIPTKLMSDSQRYFTAITSVRLWIGVNHWASSKKFSVGFAGRRPGGVGATVTSIIQGIYLPHDVQ